MWILTIGLFLAVLASAADGKASGKLTIQGKTFELKHVYAREVADAFDKTANAVEVVITSAPVPEEARGDVGLMMDLYQAGKFHGVKCEYKPEGSGVGVVIMSNAYDGSISVSRSGDSYAPKVLTKERIEGALTWEESTLGPWTYSFEFTFAANIAPRVIEAEPTPEETAKAQGTAPVKAFLALMEALRKGDKAVILAAMPAEQRAMMDGPDFPKMLEMAQAMTPKEIKVLKVTEEGSKATLVVVGVDDGTPIRGKSYLEKDAAGAWRLLRQSWGGE
jgi:hypothetical protein